MIGVVGPFHDKIELVYMYQYHKLYGVLCPCRDAFSSTSYMNRNKIINKNRKRMNAGNASDIP